MPRPRKLRLLSVRMAEGIFSVKSTISDGMQFGRICRSMMRIGETPIERAASTYSLSRSLSVSERTIRETLAQLTSVSARKILTSPSPSVYMMTMASSIVGKASMISASRISSASTHPPR